MVLKHIFQNANTVVVASPMANSQRFSDHDLNVVDEIAVPDRLEDGVREAEHQHVLDGFFAEVMVDAVDLVLVQNTMQGLVQTLRRGEVLAEWFLDYDPAPTLFLADQIGVSKLVGNIREETRRDGKVVKAIGSAAFDFSKSIGHTRVGFRIAQLPFDVKDKLQERFRIRSSWGFARGLIEAFAHELVQILIVPVPPRKAHDLEWAIKSSFCVKIVQGWQQFAPAQITGRPDDDERGRICSVHGRESSSGEAVVGIL
jgi:hypothetical protein